MRLWVDVEDLFHYADYTKRLSGIQRLAFELQAALTEVAPEAVYFVRHNKTGPGLNIVPHSVIKALSAGLTGHGPADLIEMPLDPATSTLQPDAIKKTDVVDNTPAVPAKPLLLRMRRRGRNLLPPHLHGSAIQLYIKLAEVIRAFKDFIQAIVARPSIKSSSDSNMAAPRSRTVDTPKPRTADTEALQDFATEVSPGDWLLVMGAPWSQSNYAARIQAQCQQHGLRFGVLAHDIIPLRRPEWCDQHTRRAFVDWFHGIVPMADIIFSVSQHTADDVNRYALESGLLLRNQVVPLPLGTGFGASQPPLRSGRLPAPDSFVLAVSTIEARKNHLLLFRIWRELAETMPDTQIPTLVFAGRVAWLVQDLMQQLENTDWLNGKIVLIESPSDSELSALYEDCLFTIFPSFYEGWGLPVTESLAHGSPCLASNRTSMPEAGGDLVRYFDPDNLSDALRAVREAIENPVELQLWRDRILRDFRHIPWTDTAQAMLKRMLEFDLDVETSVIAVPESITD